MASHDECIEPLTEGGEASDLDRLERESEEQVVFRIGFPDAYIDVDTQYGGVWAEDGSRHPLGDKEFLILAALARQPNQTVPKRGLLEAARLPGQIHSLPQRIRNVRRALGTTASGRNRADIIQTDIEIGNPRTGNRGHGWRAVLDNNTPALTPEKMRHRPPDVRFLGNAGLFVAINVLDLRGRLAVTENGKAISLMRTSYAALGFLAMHPNQDVNKSDLVQGAMLQAHGHRLNSVIGQLRTDLGLTADGGRRSEGIFVTLKSEHPDGNSNSEVVGYRGILEAFDYPDLSWFLQALRNANA